MTQTANLPDLRGQWKVRRVSGFLPPIGVGKLFRAADGVTSLFGAPIAPFRVIDQTLDYYWLPITDELTPDGYGGWRGIGNVFGREFCRFRLERVD